MNTINIYEAKTNLSKLIDKAMNGEEIIIAKAGKPKVKLVPVYTEKPLRKPGALKGKIWISPDFDTFIPEEFLPYIE